MRNPCGSWWNLIPWRAEGNHGSIISRWRSKAYSNKMQWNCVLKIWQNYYMLLIFPPFCLCAPASFCFTAFEDGLKTERKEGRSKEKHILDKYVFFSSWEVKCEHGWSMIPVEESNRKLVKFLTLPSSFHLSAAAQRTCKLAISLQVAGHRQAGKERNLQLDYPWWANWHKLWKTPKRQEYHTD